MSHALKEIAIICETPKKFIQFPGYFKRKSKLHPFLYPCQKANMRRKSYKLQRLFSFLPGEVAPGCYTGYWC